MTLRIDALSFLTFSSSAGKNYARRAPPYSRRDRCGDRVGPRINHEDGTGALKACLTAPNTQVAFGIRRPSGRRPYECVISQIPEPAGLVLKGYAVVFVTDSEQAWISSDILASRYSLTPTEAALATIFARGKSVQQASEIMSIAQSTVRSHLKHLMHKVGVKRQAELAAALLRNPPVRHTNRLPS